MRCNSTQLQSLTLASVPGQEIPNAAREPIACKGMVPGRQGHLLAGLANGRGANIGKSARRIDTVVA